MLKSYEAIYDHGRVEWTGAAPRCTRARVLVVIDEATENSPSPGIAQTPNGDVLADMIMQSSPEERAEIVMAFGDPVKWQREQRRERPLPGREEK